MTLKSRIDRLEHAQQSSEIPILIIRHIVDTIGAGRPAQTLRDYSGQTFTREAGEDEDGFIDRVARLVGYPVKTVALIAEG